MAKKYLIFITFIVLVLTLTFSLSGCGGEDELFEGKYIVTFDLGGGTLDYKTSSVNTQIKYAYEPNTYVIDVTEIDGYALTKNGYVFTGWYTQESCQPADKWDFKTRVIDTEELTLYAGWEKAIVYSYTLYYVDGENDVKLGSYTVKEGDLFSDWRNLAKNRDGYTPVGYFSDRTFATPWDTETAHPGGNADTDIPVYVNYIEGEWTLVGDVNAFRNAVVADKDIYLTGDIDCGGAVLSFGGTYTGTFEGNGYTVSNFTVEKNSSIRKPGCAIFATLGDGAVIRNVSFTDVIYNFTGINAEMVTEVKFAPLALTAGTITVKNVSIKGTVNTDYTGVLDKLDSVSYELIGADSVVTEEVFDATVTRVQVSNP